MKVPPGARAQLIEAQDDAWRAIHGVDIFIRGGLYRTDRIPAAFVATRGDLPAAFFLLAAHDLIEKGVAHGGKGSEALQAAADAIKKFNIQSVPACQVMEPGHA